MSLLKQWRTDPTFLESKHVRQIIAIAGDGRLKDGNHTSHEFREFIKNISPEMLARFSRECLEEAFTDSGFVLQDLINEIGRRIGFTVTDGRYRGIRTDIGNDGLWQLPDKRTLVVEIKTTDAYRINLDSIAGYLHNLRKRGDIDDDQGSALIVVGRNDTGDLEAQVRGSRHAWNMRLISVEALVKLLLLRSDLEEPATIKRIYDVLFPREFTRLDAIIDLAFETVSDVRATDAQEVPDEEEDGKPIPNWQEKTPTPEHREKKFTPVAFNEACAKFVATRKGYTLVKQSRASFVSPNGDLLLLCLVSRRHDRSESGYFWFALHSHQMERLRKAQRGLVAFGCGSADNVVLLEKNQLESWLDGMNRTVTEDRDYWHVQIGVEANGKMWLIRRAGVEKIDLSDYRVV